MQLINNSIIIECTGSLGFQPFYLSSNWIYLPLKGEFELTY